MPRQRDPRRDEAFELWKKHNGDIKLKNIADQLQVSEGTVRGWKNKDKWEVKSNGTFQTKIRNVPKEKKRVTKRNRSGNPNPVPKFTKHNKAAERHGLFSKFLPDETLKIVDSILDSSNSLDLLWDQIRIQYAAILRAQKIMFVRDQEDMTREIKKEKETDHGTEIEYEIQFAWDKHATFLNAQSRAISTLESLISKYEQTLPNDLVMEEQRLKLEKLKVDIAKVKGEEGQTEDDGFMDALKAESEEVWTDDNET